VTGRRFDGAITTPADSGEAADASQVPVPQRPPRPVLIELASAILIVGGATATVSALAYAGSGQAGGTGPLAFLFLVIDVLTVVVGIRIRSGRWWVLAINVVAVALFLELTALPNAFAILFAAFDTLVLFALLRHRAWFEWTPEADAGRPGEDDRR
jgi:hypothetical protein